MIRKAARTGCPPPPWRFRPRRRLEEVATSRLGTVECVWALLRRVCAPRSLALWLSLRDVKPPRCNSHRSPTPPSTRVGTATCSNSTIAVGQQPITEFDVPEEPPAEMTAYAITYTSKTGQTALWQGASLELADIDDDIADANGEIDPDRIPEAPQPECPTGGCARDRAKAEAAKEEL